METTRNGILLKKKEFVEFNEKFFYLSQQEL